MGSETVKKGQLLDVSTNSAPSSHGAGAGEEFPPLESLIIAALDDDKAEDVTVIDLDGKSSIADTMIIASGRSARHVSSIADHLVRKLKEEGYGRAQVGASQMRTGSSSMLAMRLCTFSVRKFAAFISWNVSGPVT